MKTAMTPQPPPNFRHQYAVAANILKGGSELYQLLSYLEGYSSFLLKHYVSSISPSVHKASFIHTTVMLDYNRINYITEKDFENYFLL